jgi:hypothetical protein
MIQPLCGEHPFWVAYFCWEEWKILSLDDYVINFHYSWSIKHWIIRRMIVYDILLWERKENLGIYIFVLM